MGATVLHEDAIFPVRKEGIPINIRNTNHPEDKGTFIVESTCRKPKYTITGIAGKKGFCSINIEKSMMNSEIGFGRKVLQVFEDQGISFEHIPSGIDTLTVYVHQDEFEEKEQQVIAGIHRAVSSGFCGNGIRSGIDRRSRTGNEVHQRNCRKDFFSTGTC